MASILAPRTSKARHCRRSRAENAVRNLLRSEHHAACDRGNRPLERAEFRARSTRGPATRRRALLSRISLSLVHEDQRSGPARLVGLPAQPAAEQPGESAARSEISVRLALAGVGMEAVVFLAGSFRC